MSRMSDFQPPSKHSASLNGGTVAKPLDPHSDSQSQPDPHSNDQSVLPGNSQSQPGSNSNDQQSAKKKSIFARITHFFRQF